jgi:myo-inositol-1(or 4)-monophosphatase
MSDTPPADDLLADHELLISATREAGAVALDYFNGTVKSWEKKPNDPVSEADIEIDRLLKERLQGPRPDYGWLSEESEDDSSRLKQRRTWIIDPIDGTRGFIAGRAEFAVCVALIEGGVPIAGAVFNPATNEFFEAVAGGGARLNNAAIQIGTRPSLKGAKLLGTEKIHDKMCEWSDDGKTVERTYFNSIAYRVALVAANKYDAAVSIHYLNDWDLAAADLIVREAGGIATDHAGNIYRYNGKSTQQLCMVVSNAALQPPLVDFVGYARANW